MSDHTESLFRRITVKLVRKAKRVFSGIGDRTDSTEIPDPAPGNIFLDKTDISSPDRYMPLQRMTEEEKGEIIDPLQCMQRLQAIGYIAEDLSDPAAKMKDLSDRIEKELSDHLQPLSWSNDKTFEFNGTKTSELSQFIGKLQPGETVRILVRSRELIADGMVSLPSGVIIDGAGTRIIPDKEMPQGPDKLFLLDGVRNVCIKAFTVDACCRHGIFIKDSSCVSLEDLTIRGLAGKGISLIGDNDTFRISGCRIPDGDDGGICINGDSSDGIIEDCIISGQKSSENFSAGILLGAVRIIDPYSPNNPVEDVRLETLTHAPHDIIIRNNLLENNNAQGCYIHAGYRCYIIENRVTDNQKEGLCLDYGTAYSYVCRNDISGNGGRLRIARAGTEHLKLPGISLDNAVYNTVCDNIFSDNHGSGIKIVRTGVRNAIFSNTVCDNNKGVNAKGHFFGIELASSLIPDRKDCIGLDFTPCYENTVTRNTVTGPHYAGIFVGRGAYMNDCISNIVTDTVYWSVENLSERSNTIVNNIVDNKSRGL